MDGFFITTDPDVEREKMSLQELAERFKQKQKEIKRLAKEKHTRRIHRVGELAAETDLLQLNDDVLRGAFLEIQSKLTDEAQLAEWQIAGQLGKEVGGDGNTNAQS